MNCSRGCTPPSEEERQNIKKWSENIANLLMHDQGREKYRCYLQEYSAKEDLDTLEFWEMVLQLEKQANALIDHKESLWTSESANSKETRQNRFNTSSVAVIDFANEKINFDLRQLRELETIKNDAEKFKEMLPRIQQTLQSLLRDSYDTFIMRQVKSRLSISTSQH